MKRLLPAIILATCSFLTAADDPISQDWPNLTRFRDENAKLPPPYSGETRVVFMGDSITQLWGTTSPEFFEGKSYINRGISGQTTPQMLIRFRQDVIALKPRVVVILAGTNDIAGNTGPTTIQAIEDNLESMVELARASGIRVVLATVLPAAKYPWKPEIEPVGKIAELNAWIKQHASRSKVVYLDLFSVMADAKLGMRPDLTTDGVHPNKAGYAIMAPLVEKAISQAK